MYELFSTLGLGEEKLVVWGSNKRTVLMLVSEVFTMLIERQSREKGLRSISAILARILELILLILYFEWWMEKINSQI